MEWWLILGIIFSSLIVLLAIGVPVAFAFLIINLAGAALLQGGAGGFQQLIHSIYGSVTSFSLLPIPLFVLMGEILWQTNIAARALTALDRLLGRVPGRLSLLTVLSGTIFAALSGSTIANTAMLGSLLLPELKKRGKGKMIHTGSIFGAYGVPSAVAYCVTKMAIHGLTRALAIELAPFKINVNAVAPGNIVTPLNDPLYDYVADHGGTPGNRESGKKALVNSYPLGRLGEVTDIAPAVVYFASDAADFVTGQILFVDGGYSVW